MTGSEPVELESFPGINSKLSAAPPLRLEEVKALTIATEAFRGDDVICEMYPCRLYSHLQHCSVFV